MGAHEQKSQSLAGRSLVWIALQQRSNARMASTSRPLVSRDQSQIIVGRELLRLQAHAFAQVRSGASRWDWR